MISHGISSVYVGLGATVVYGLVGTIASKKIPSLPELLTALITTLGYYSALTIGIEMLGNYEHHNLDTEQLVVLEIGCLATFYISVQEFIKSLSKAIEIKKPD